MNYGLPVRQQIRDSRKSNNENLRQLGNAVILYTHNPHFNFDPRLGNTYNDFYGVALKNAGYAQIEGAVFELLNEQDYFVAPKL